MRRRIHSLDILKILSAYGVIQIHVCAWILSRSKPFDVSWTSALLLDGLVRWCVPVFVMVTGALLLNTDSAAPSLEALKKTFIKRLTRLVIIYFSWSIVYSAVDVLSHGWNGISAFVSSVILGKYHMWYLVMLSGLYLVSPALEYLLSNRAIAKFTAIVCIGISNIQTLLPIFPFSKPLQDAFANLSLEMGYTGYYLFGALIIHRNAIKKTNKNTFFIAVCSCIVTAGLVLLTSYSSKALDETCLDYFFPLTTVSSISLFSVLSRTRIDARHAKLSTRKKVLLKAITHCAESGMGIYVSHVLVLNLLLPQLLRAGFNVPTLVFIPVTTILIYLLCLLFVGLLRKIPVLHIIV